MPPHWSHQRYLLCHKLQGQVSIDDTVVRIKGKDLLSWPVCHLAACKLSATITMASRWLGCWTPQTPQNDPTSISSWSFDHIYYQWPWGNLFQRHIGMICCYAHQPRCLATPDQESSKWYLHDVPQAPCLPQDKVLKHRCFGSEKHGRYPWFHSCSAFTKG